MRSKLAGPEDLKRPQFSALLQNLARKLARTTNMHLENLLSEIKAAVPTGKQKAYGEKMSYLAHLSQLMKQHLQRGRVDSRRPQQQDELLAMGVQLDRRVRRRSGSRPDASWCMVKLQEWRSQNPDATKFQESQQLQLFKKELGAMCKVERDAALASVPDLRPLDQANQGDDHDGDEDESADHAADLFDIGCREWPVRDEVLRSFLHGHLSHKAGGFAGVANKATMIRSAERAALIVMDQGTVFRKLMKTACSMTAHIPPMFEARFRKHGLQDFRM